MEIRIGKKYRKVQTQAVYTLDKIVSGTYYLAPEDSSNGVYAACSSDKFEKYYEPVEETEEEDKENENVEHPSHYTWLKDKCGIEVIDIVRHLDFDLGNALKYILRAGHKHEEGYTNSQKAIEDLKKAIWYIKDKIATLEGK